MCISCLNGELIFFRVVACSGRHLGYLQNVSAEYEAACLGRRLLFEWLRLIEYLRSPGWSLHGHPLGLIYFRCFFEGRAGAGPCGRASSHQLLVSRPRPRQGLPAQSAVKPSHGAQAFCVSDSVGSLFLHFGAGTNSYEPHFDPA